MHRHRGETKTGKIIHEATAVFENFSEEGGIYKEVERATEYAE